jgi:hypothetical protein
VTACVSVATAWLTFELVKRREIETMARAELAKQRENFRLVAEHDRDERVRLETLRWANPILDAQGGLAGRLDNILKSAGYLALSREYKHAVNPNWSISYDYFMDSTLFFFGQYFAQIEKFKRELSFELFQSQREKDQLLEDIGAVERALSDFPPSYSCNGEDNQVFALQQRAMGDLLSTGASDEKARITNFAEFQENIATKKYRQQFAPLRALLEEVTPANECRWKRLETTRNALRKLEHTCRGLLSLKSPVADSR